MNSLIIDAWAGYWHSKYFGSGKRWQWIVGSLIAKPNIYYWQMMNWLGLILTGRKEG